MAVCEKCWEESQLYKDPLKAYYGLIKKRKCSPEEQAGRDAEQYPICGRYSMHIHCNVCMACGYISLQMTNAFKDIGDD